MRSPQSICTLLFFCSAVAADKISPSGAARMSANNLPGLLRHFGQATERDIIPATAPKISPVVVRGVRSTARRLIELVLASEAIAAVPRRFPKSVDPTAVLFFANAVVFGLWKVSKESGEHELCRWMHTNFVHRHVDNKEGKARWKRGKQPPSHTILTSAFSHENFDHFASNMGVLETFGPKVSEALGTRAFSYFYVAAIYASTLFNERVYLPNFEPPQKRKFLFLFLRPIASLGASGAISAVVSYYCLKFPLDWLKLSDFAGPETEESTQTGSLVSRIRIRAWVVGLFFFANDALRLGGEANIGYGAHIGGSIFGASVYFVNRLYGAQIQKVCAAISAEFNAWTRPPREVLAKVTGAVCSRWLKFRARMASAFKSVFRILSERTWSIFKLVVAVMSELVEFGD